MGSSSKVAGDTGKGTLLFYFLHLTCVLLAIVKQNRMTNFPESGCTHETVLSRTNVLIKQPCNRCPSATSRAQFPPQTKGTTRLLCTEVTHCDLLLSTAQSLIC